MSGISHSRVESYLSCRRKDFYGYQYPTAEGRGIRRVTVSNSLGLGTAVHRILAAFYSAILEAGDTKAAQAERFEEAVDVAYQEMEAIKAEGFEDAGGRITELDVLIRRYFDNEPFVKYGYVVLAVEAEFNLEYDTDADASLPFVIDLILRDPTLRIVVVDHKTAYRLYSEETLKILPQIPKYIAGLRALGKPVAYGMYNVIRTERANGGKMVKADMVDTLVTLTDGDPKVIGKMLVPALTEALEKHGVEAVKPPAPEQVLQQLPFEPSATRITRTFTEQMGVAQELMARDALPIEEAEATAWRTANSIVCDHCQFFAICTEELRGGNVLAALANDYEPKPKREKIPVSNGDEDE